MLIGVDASRVTRPRRTGTENYSLHVLREVLRQDRENRYRLYLSAPLPPGLLAPRPEMDRRVIRLPRLWTQVGLSLEMLRAAPDLLFVPSHVLPLVLPRRSVVVIYDVGHRLFPAVHTRTERLYLEWSIRRHVRLASQLLTISETSKADIVRLYGADPSRISVAYPAVDEAFRPRPADEVARVRQRYGLAERYVLHVGTVKPRKNLPRLVEAFARAAIPPDTCLALVGATSHGGEALENAIGESGLGDRVRTLSFVDGADLPALYAGSACTAVVSLYEGFGIPALEAMACGAPAVVSRNGSLPEVAGDAAVLVDPLDAGSIADGLEQALNDLTLSERLRAAGPSHAGRFTWAEAGRVTLDALERAGRS